MKKIKNNTHAGDKINVGKKNKGKGNTKTMPTIAAKKLSKYHVTKGQSSMI